MRRPLLLLEIVPPTVWARLKILVRAALEEDRRTKITIAFILGDNAALLQEVDRKAWILFEIVPEDGLLFINISRRRVQASVTALVKRVRDCMGSFNGSDRVS